MVRLPISPRTVIVFAATTLLAATCWLGCRSSSCTTANFSSDDTGEEMTVCYIPIVRQETKNDCGKACLLSVAAYWCASGSTERADALRQTKDSPLSLKECKATAEGWGLKAFVVSCKTQSVEQVCAFVDRGFPPTLAVRMPHGRYFAEDVPVYGVTYRYLVDRLGMRKNHYVVLMGHDKRSVLLMDPGHGCVKVSKRFLKDIWSDMSFACLVCVQVAATKPKSEP